MGLPSLDPAGHGWGNFNPQANAEDRCHNLARKDQQILRCNFGAPGRAGVGSPHGQVQFAVGPFGAQTLGQFRLLAGPSSQGQCPQSLGRGEIGCGA